MNLQRQLTLQTGPASGGDDYAALDDDFGGPFCGNDRRPPLSYLFKRLRLLPRQSSPNRGPRRGL